MAFSEKERCKALTKKTGERCKNRAVHDGLCPMHFGLSRSGSTFWSKAGSVATKVGAGAAAAAPIIEIIRILVGSMATHLEHRQYAPLQLLEHQALDADSAEPVEEVAAALMAWFESLPQAAQAKVNEAIQRRMREYDAASGSAQQEAV